LGKILGKIFENIGKLGKLNFKGDFEIFLKYRESDLHLLAVVEPLLLLLDPFELFFGNNLCPVLVLLALILRRLRRFALPWTVVVPVKTTIGLIKLGKFSQVLLLVNCEIRVFEGVQQVICPEKCRK